MNVFCGEVSISVEDQQSAAASLGWLWDEE